MQFLVRSFDGRHRTGTEQQNRKSFTVELVTALLFLGFPAYKNKYGYVAQGT